MSRVRAFFSGCCCFFWPTVLLALLVPGAAGAADWPQFHGPRRDNKSDETGLLSSWPEDGPPLVWTARGLGHGFASVAMADGRLYTAGNLHDQTVITALDLEGNVLWQRENGPAWVKSVPGARGTPTLDGDRLYHESPLGDVVCLQARTGRPVWSRNILEAFGSENITWALAESLLVDGPRLICNPGGPKTAIVALDKHSGRTVWQSASAGGDLAGYGSPILFQQAGRRIIAKLTSKALVGVDADSGKLLWRFPHETPFDENIFTPIYHDGRLFISTRTTGSVMLRLDVQGDGATVTPVWRSQNLDNQHGGVVLVDGYLYGSCHVRNHAQWVCLDWTTGKQRWANRLEGKGSLTYAEGMLYTMNERGTVTLLRATPESCQIAGRFQLPEGGRGPTWAHPVVSGGRLYLRHGDLLFAYDVRAK